MYQSPDAFCVGVMIHSNFNPHSKYVMSSLDQLFENNQRWAADMRAKQSTFFENQATGQKPPYLWIGCADSRVPANEIIGLPPGQVFVHRNIANLVNHTDLNCLSVLEYAVNALKVTDIIVCGHYKCGGVAAALANQPVGLIDNWLRHIKDVYHASELPEQTGLSDQDRADRLCEMNVAAQVRNVSRTTIVQDAWRNKQPLAVHGLIYSLEDGLLDDLDLCIEGPEQVSSSYRMHGAE